MGGSILGWDDGMGYLGEFFQYLRGIPIESHWNYQESKCNHISILKGSQEHLDSSRQDEIWVILSVKYHSPG